MLLKRWITPLVTSTNGFPEMKLILSSMESGLGSLAPCLLAPSPEGVPCLLPASRGLPSLLLLLLAPTLPSQGVLSLLHTHSSELASLC